MINDTVKMNEKIRVCLKITAFDGVLPKSEKILMLDDIAGKDKLELEGSLWNVSWNVLHDDERKNISNWNVKFNLASGELKNANVSVGFIFSEWKRDNYVFMPASAYNGNRFRAIRMKYPPMLHEKDCIGADMPITTTDIPRLMQDGKPAWLHFRSGDLATPCMGFWSKKFNEGFQLYAEQDTDAGYTGFLVNELEDSAELWLESPAVRKLLYRWSNSERPSDDNGYDFSVGDEVVLDFKVNVFECEDINKFYKEFFSMRKVYHDDEPYINILPFSAAFSIIEKEYLANHWNEKSQYIRLNSNKEPEYTIFGDWQTGWVGGGLSSLAFVSSGTELSKERAVKTITTAFERLQNKNGWLYAIEYNGTIYGDDFDDHENYNVLLLRKNADFLLFSIRQIMLMKNKGIEVPEEWFNGVEKLADAFVRLWNKYGQFGQYIDIEEETILIGGTASVGIAPGALCLASELLGKEEYLQTAIAAAKKYYDDFLMNGITNGGPGDILQAPDSESVFGLLESYVRLYDATKDIYWIECAENCARQCASWCVSYDFHFPEETVFGTLGMKTKGSVYASVTNKHSAPGFCVGSGQSFLKLYKLTKDRRYLDVCRDTAHNITQYLSREDRLIYSWEDKYLKPGWMCERVNMSDWETKQNMGGVFYGSCSWCIISCLLTYCEIPGILFHTDTGEAIVFDHVEAEVMDEGDFWTLKVTNRTEFDANVRILVDNENCDTVLSGEFMLDGCTDINVPSHEERKISFKKIKLL
ncbi:MAG: hypothetical protein E7267_04860 [Lachnospiraceae bacterium]|nr:hypothetical protein [Lachnospiraceae bacterium]